MDRSRSHQRQPPYPVTAPPPPAQPYLANPSPVHAPETIRPAGGELAGSSPVLPLNVPNRRKAQSHSISISAQMGDSVADASGAMSPSRQPTPLSGTKLRPFGQTPLVWGSAPAGPVLVRGDSQRLQLPSVRDMEAPPTRALADGAPGGTGPVLSGAAGKGLLNLQPFVRQAVVKTDGAPPVIIRSADFWRGTRAQRSTASHGSSTRFSRPAVLWALYGAAAALLSGAAILAALDTTGQTLYVADFVSMQSAPVTTKHLAPFAFAERGEPMQVIEERGLYVLVRDSSGEVGYVARTLLSDRPPAVHADSPFTRCRVRPTERSQAACLVRADGQMKACQTHCAANPEAPGCPDGCAVQHTACLEMCNLHPTAAAVGQP